jgi:hypothetical protein
MDEEKYKSFLKQNKKSENTINSYVNSVKILEDFLITHGKNKSIDEAEPEDIRAFFSWGKKELHNVYRTFWGIKGYYQFTRAAELENKVSELMEFFQNETRLLGEFPKTDQKAVDKLASIGIRTVNQLLNVSKTRRDREILAEKSGVDIDSILELVKMSNLSRLPGLKKVRCRLYYEGGLDTLAKIAALEAGEIRKILSEFVESSGFEGSPPTEGEAQASITMARFLPEIIEL